MRHPVSTEPFMRVPRALLVVPGRRAQYGSTGPESRVPNPRKCCALSGGPKKQLATSGCGGARLRRVGVTAGEGRA